MILNSFDDQLDRGDKRVVSEMDFFSNKSLNVDDEIKINDNQLHLQVCN